MISIPFFKRRTGPVLFAAIVVLLFSFIVLRRHDRSRDHFIVPDTLLNSITPHSSSSNDWATICHQHNFPPFPNPRKVFDLVLFSTELDWLEIRLHTHAPYVDYFVIIESPTTFTNLPKPLHLQDNWARFHQFHHKIIYRIVPDPIISTRHWDHEDYLRNALLTQVFPSLSPDQAANTHDVLLVSDMDELLNPDALQLLRHCSFPSRLTLRTSFYYYSFQWRHRGPQWAHPQATTYQGSIAATIAPNDLRQNLLGPAMRPLAALSRWWNAATLWNAGWHCSSCLSTIREVRFKMASFSHQLWNTEANRDAKTMVHRVRNGLDLFGRKDELYDRVELNADIPDYVLEEWEREGRFRYLLDRDGEEAGFEDWRELVGGR